MLTDQEYDFIKRAILRNLQIDLSFYKTQQMHRRLSGLISSQADNVAGYVRLIESDKDALSKLKNFLTINVSEFFRDSQQFDILQKTVLPELLKNRAQLKIWSAGSSHGGEAYSVAMILDELAPNRGHKIFATDIDDAILERAKMGGPYGKTDVNNVPTRHLLKFFNKEGNEYFVSDAIKKRVTFRRQNLLHDKFDSGFDLVICRNVVIYFSDEAKTKLYQNFFNSIKDGGMMFIGATETLLGASDIGLERVTSCFYRKPSNKQRVPVPSAAGTIGKK